MLQLLDNQHIKDVRGLKKLRYSVYELIFRKLQRDNDCLTHYNNKNIIF